jgi:endonuclease/exonuclease/phosphatase family metal-dependent hydrolase
VRVLTSRNVVPPLQRLAANLNPDLIASWEGGSNQLFVRAPGRVLEHRTLTLTRRPERRRMVWARVRLPRGETVCLANLHASAGLPAKATGEVLAAAAAAAEWSGGDPLVFGGDLNLRPAREAQAFAELRERLRLGDPTAPDAIDHILARDLEIVERPARLEAEERELPAEAGLRLRLSDHAPVLARFEVK